MLSNDKVIVDNTKYAEVDTCDVKAQTKQYASTTSQSMWSYKTFAVAFLIVTLSLGIGLGLGLGLGSVRSSSVDRNTIGNTQVVFGKQATGGARRLLIFEERFGEVNSSQLHSMQYYFTRISLCTSLFTSGSAYGNCENEWVLYSNTDQEMGYATYDSAAAAADTDPSHYIDLLSLEGRNMLVNKTHQMPLSIVGKVFTYAVTSWMRPIKVQADIPYNSSVTMYTKAFVAPPVFEPSFENTGPSQLGVAILENGGSFSKLLTPFTATPGNWSFLMAFNPDELIGVYYRNTGYNSNTGESYCTANGMTDVHCNEINTPMLSLTAIVYPTQQVIEKETYLIDIPAFGGQSTNTLRIDVYYNTADRLSVLNIGVQCVGPNAYNSAGGQNCGNYISEIQGSGEGPYKFFKATYDEATSQPTGRIAWLWDFMRSSTVGTLSGNVTYMDSYIDGVYVNCSILLLEIAGVK